MKKQLLFLSIIFLFLFNNVSAQTVYITKTGAKYHRENCRYLSRSSIAISLANALSDGYTACSVCRPPLKVSITKSNRSSNASARENQSNSKSSSIRRAVSVQCSATTKAGNRCKRMTKSPNGLCWQHGGN